MFIISYVVDYKGLEGERVGRSSARARTGRGMGLDEWRIPSEQKNLNTICIVFLTMALRRRQLLILITSLNDS